MATVPAVLLIGDSMVNGGVPGLDAKIDATGFSEVDSMLDFELGRITPSDDTTGAPTASSLGWWPWYDGMANDTHYTVASATSTTVTASGSPGWTVNQFAGKYVLVVNTLTVGFSNVVLVTSNTANTLTVASWPGGTPSPGNIFWPQVGRWRDYHPVQGFLTVAEIGVTYSQRGGGSWPANAQGVGYDAGLIRRFLEVWDSAPYFQLAKHANSQPTVGAWDTPASGARTTFEAQVAAMAAAWTALATGDTLSWELIIWDNSQQDVLDWVSTPANALLYETAVTDTIAYLRTQLGNANAKVLLVNHDTQINNLLSPNGTLFANRAHRSVAKDGTNVRVVSLEGQRVRGDDPSYYLGTENREFYAAAVAWDQAATKIRDAYELIVAGDPTTYDGGYPIYLFMGDSIGVGPINETFTGQLDSPLYTDTARASTQGIYNRSTDTVEPYDMADNSNTSGTVRATGGPECSMMALLEQLHPTGFVLVKRASDASSLAAELSAYTGGGSSGGVWDKSVSSEHWDAFVEDYENALQYVNTTLGKQGDLKGVFVILGTNDAQVTGGGAVFEAALATFVSDVRETFATRTSGTALPIVWRKPQLDFTGAKPDEIATIRTALEDFAEDDAQFVLVNVDDLERNTTDDIHETPRASLTDGERLVAALSGVAI